MILDNLRLYVERIVIEASFELKAIIYHTDYSSVYLYLYFVKIN